MDSSFKIRQTVILDDADIITAIDDTSAMGVSE